MTLATALLQDLLPDPGIAGAVFTGKQLHAASLDLGGIFPACAARVLEAEDPFLEDGGFQGTIGQLGLPGGYAELLVEPGQEFSQHGAGTVDGGGTRQLEFADQPVLKDACHTFCPTLRLWRPGEGLSSGQFPHDASEVSGFHRRLDVRDFPADLKTPGRST